MTTERMFEQDRLDRLEQALEDLVTYESGNPARKQLSEAESAAHQEAYVRLLDRSVSIRRDIEVLTGDRDMTIRGRVVDPLRLILGPRRVDDSEQDKADCLGAVIELRNMLRRAIGAARESIELGQSSTRTSAGPGATPGVTVEGSGQQATRTSLSVGELEHYLSDLVEYRKLSILAAEDRGPNLSPDQVERRTELRATLVRRRGRVQPLVERILGIRETHSTKDFPPKNDWEIAFEGYGWNTSVEFQAKIIDRLNDVIGRVQDDSSLLLAPDPPPGGGRRTIGANSNKVFIVHGTNPRRHEVKGVLTGGGLEGILLEDQAAGGRTIIEQIEVYGDVGYVVVLMTGDDVGRRATEPPTSDQPRARQNVVLELGYFVGRLGRDRVAAIVEHGVEKPSDWSGVVYIDFDTAGGWKSRLANELSAAGLTFDLYGLLGIRPPGAPTS